MTKAWRLVRFLFSAAGWALLVACAALLALIGIGPHVAHYRTLSVLSGSMEPGIPVGAIVIVTEESPRDLRAGQIITYKVPVDDRPVISHRVVEVVEGEGTDQPVFRTKGDANEAADPWLAKVDGPTVWQVRHTVPGVGRLVYLLRRPGVHTAAVRVIPALLAVLWLIGIWRHESAEKDLTPTLGNPLAGRS
ncbi:MAG: signal peptidase [Actinomycetota bacterium]|nr:signal peptidase [Actinomycetota bacterium]